MRYERRVGGGGGGLRVADERVVSEVVELLGLWGGSGEVVWGAVAA